MDLGTLAPATTPNWFDAYSPTTIKREAAFVDVTYALTDELKVDVGARVNHYDYRFSSCISGWGSGYGAATPSCSGLIALSSTSFNPKFNLRRLTVNASICYEDWRNIQLESYPNYRIRRDGARPRRLEPPTQLESPRVTRDGPRCHQHRRSEDS